MLRSKKIAITGGIAVGKSTVCDFFKQFGGYVIRSDEIVHSILTPETQAGKQIIELLGEQIVVKGQLDRKKIAEIAFNDKIILNSLEKIIHPVVLDDINKKISAITGKYPCIFVEIPLLFEIGQADYFDYVITVTAEESNCIKRLAKKGVSEREYKKRMLHQMNPQSKAQKADFVIDNDSSLDELKEKAYKLYNSLLTV